jgi:hypothetical protein
MGLTSVVTNDSFTIEKWFSYATNHPHDASTNLLEYHRRTIRWRTQIKLKYWVGQYSYYVTDGLCLGKETKETIEDEPHIQREIKIGGSEGRKNTFANIKQSC